MNRSMIQIDHSGASSLAGTSKKYTSDVLVLGRRQDCDVVFDADRDRLVSGRHAEIASRDGKIHVRDLGSSNGTFVNGRGITSSRTVGPRDRIMLGPDGPELRVELLDVTLGSGRIESAASDGGTRAQRAPIGLQTMMRAIETSVGKERKRTTRVAAGAAVRPVRVLRRGLRRPTERLKSGG